MDPDTQVRNDLRRRRRWSWSVGANVVVSVLLAVFLVLLLNYLSSRLYWRSDVSASNAYRLSAQTERLLNELPGPVDVYVIFHARSDMRRQVESLVREYTYRSPLIRVEFIDPDRHLARAEEMARRFNITAANTVVVHYEGRHHHLAATDFIEYDYRDTPARVPVASAQFRGEQILSSALYRVTQSSLPTVYFLTGHGERQFDNFDPVAGFSGIGQYMRNAHVRLEYLQLGEQRTIPDDAAVLVVAGPTRRLPQSKQNLVHAYLDQGGRALWLIDSMTETGLEPFFERWNVQLGRGIVIEPHRSRSGELFITAYGRHPVTNRVLGKTSIFYNPRPVEPASVADENSVDQADKPHVTVLATSSAAGWVKRDPHSAPVRFNPAVDRQGPIPVAVAVERGPVPGIDVQIRPTRMVVFGNASFVSNGGLTGGDKDLFMGALDWLLDQEEMMYIDTREVQEAILVLDRKATRVLMWWTMGALPVAVLLLGLFVRIRRRT